VEYDRLRLDLQDVGLSANDTLVESHMATNRIYFLGRGVCCINATTADGGGAAVALVGNEGAIGMGGFFSDLERPKISIVEIVNGTAQVMDMGVFRREMAHPGSFSELMHRYCHTFTESLMQSVACNALHSIDQRYARCLLEIRDRVSQNEFALTQDALAGMLGVRRASITLAAGALHRSAIIEHGHKRVVIHDAGRLERAACECYAINRTYFARLLS
jgi:CRP-like cAMP-binding protein